MQLHRRDRGVAQSLGAPLLIKVKESRVLLVGAGGIGCELLKNLVCCGFGSAKPTQPPPREGEAASAQEAGEAQRRKAEIVVIDLDTIDLSNLNRQFLFRKHHIKKPKAFVAKETASRFNPSVTIDAQHASIFDDKYGVEFFEGFDVVFNALDNLAARRHVNKMCLAANVPLIESGTTGFNGQVQAIKKGVTECYDCNPKPVQKSFPICTIRSTPSQPIHCIVWAKSYLFPELFGTPEDDSDTVTVTAEDSAEEVAKLKEEAEALQKIRRIMGQSEFAQEVFNKVFHDDIERLRSIADMWAGGRRPPESLRFDELSERASIVKQGQALAAQDQRPWSLLENISVFCYSLDTLSSRAQGGESVIEFDKDDKDTLDFVAAASNLRSHIFGIPLQSEWEIKQMAGNIIPAIATSNALTASLCVLEAFKILRPPPKGSKNDEGSSSAQSRSAASKEDSLLGGSKMVFLQSKSTERMMTSQALLPPHADCPVCSPVYAKIVMPESAKPALQHLVDLLKAQVGYEDFSITLDNNVIYDPDLQDNLEKSLSELGIDGHGNRFLTVMDDGDDSKVDLVLSVKVQLAAEGEADGTTLQLLPQNVELPLKSKPQSANSELNGEEDQAPKPDPSSNAGSTKRKREGDADAVDDSTKKKTKVDEDQIQIMEDDGAIVLDDD